MWNNKEKQAYQKFCDTHKCTGSILQRSWRKLFRQQGFCLITTFGCIGTAYDVQCKYCKKIKDITDYYSW